MINRKLIRLKTVQIVYSHYLNGSSHEVKDGESQLMQSMGAAYELYNTLLLLMVEISRLALRQYEAQSARSQRLGQAAPSRKFVDNRFMLQLEGNRQLAHNRQSQRIDWSNEEEFVRSLLNQITDTDFFKDYMASGKNTYDEDRELWRQIFRNVIVDNEAIDDILEDFNLYWNDDRFIIDSFVIKTINRFSEQSGDDQPLVPEYDSDEEVEFARKLITQALGNDKYYQSLIAQNTRNWDIERVPLMDRVIMQVALAEITSFPTIPTAVSINESIDIAKAYSTPNSGKYVNATLDNISKTLIAERKLVKS